MQVTLFRALKSANIEDEAAAKAVAVVEEHIDMAVSRAVMPLEQKIAGLETTLEKGLKGMQTSIDGLKWYMIGLGSLMTIIATAGAVLTAYAQYLK